MAYVCSRGECEPYIKPQLYCSTVLLYTRTSTLDIFIAAALRPLTPSSSYNLLGGWLFGRKLYLDILFQAGDQA